MYSIVVFVQQTHSGVTPLPQRADADTEAPLQAVTAPPQRAPFPAVGVMFEKEEESRVKLLTPLKRL